MAYREVAMVDVKEVLRLWMGGAARNRIAAQLGLDPKTVRRYVRGDDRRVAETGRATHQGPRAAAPPGRKPPVRDAAPLRDRGLRLRAHGTDGAGGRPPPRRGSPGRHRVDDALLAPDAQGRRRRFRAWIFTAVYSRYRFVYPWVRSSSDGQRDRSVRGGPGPSSAACSGVLIPDNTKAVIRHHRSAPAPRRRCLPRVHAGPRPPRRSHPRAPPARQGRCFILHLVPLVGGNSCPAAG